MKRLNEYSIIIYLCITFLVAACTSGPDTGFLQNSFHYIQPNYGNAEIRIGSDTLEFSFPDTLYHKVKSFNLFTTGGKHYMSMFDSKKQFILIYDLYTQNFITQLPVDSFFANNTDFYTTAYVMNFDSIFIFSNRKVQLFDSSMVLKKTVEFTKDQRPDVLTFSSGNPPIFVGNKIFTGVRQKNSESSFGMLAKQKIIYEFNLQNKKAKLSYSLPETYRAHYYGFQFLQRCLCYNDRQRFVLSFAADSNIYETDLSDYNHSYLGKSRYQIDPINPMPETDSNRFKDQFKNYRTNDAYGNIYFDSYHKRYLRVSFQKISEIDFLARRPNRPQSLIIFDEGFRIIGESRIDANIDCESIFFTPDGRVWAMLRSEKRSHSIQFVGLEYYEKSMRATK